MSTKTLRFQLDLHAKQPWEPVFLIDHLEVTAEISHSNGTFLGIRLYHDALSKKRDKLPRTPNYPYREISRSAIGTGHDSMINFPTEYLLWTCTAGTAIEAAAKTINWHLQGAVFRKLKDKTQDFLAEHEWCRYAYDDQIVIPISTVLIAMCQDESLLHLFDGTKPLNCIPRWHVQMAYAGGNKSSHAELQSSHLIQDIYVTDNADHYRTIVGAYSRR